MNQFPQMVRHAELDTIRGVAVMGILAMNIIAFAMPGGAYFSPIVYGDSRPLDIVLWAGNFILFDSKMRALFAILFGASSALIAERAIARQASPAKAHFSRMGWLLLFGLAHLYLIWWGDILTLYALCGLVLYPFLSSPTVKLAGLAAALIAATCLLWGAGFAALLMAQASIAQGLDPSAIAQAYELLDKSAHDFGLTATQIVRSLDIYSGSYPAIVTYRLVELGWSPVTMVIQTGPETLAQMLIGVILYRTGMLTGHWPSILYRRIAVIGLAVALPVQAALAAYLLLDNFSVVAIFGSYLVVSLPFDILQAVAYASLVILWVRSNRFAWLLRRTAAAGRVAFSNYLGTSIVMTSLFYGYGLGLFGQIGRPVLWVFVLLAWMVMLLWSASWLRHFRYGPFEWLWRSLARRSPQPMHLEIARRTQ